MPANQPIAIALIVSFVLTAGYFLYDRVFWIRWLSQPPGENVLTAWEWYKPVERIGSGPSAPLPVADASSATLTSSAIKDAVDYAKAFDSIAFLVAHKGVLQVEMYSEGYDRATVLDSQSMHKGLLGVAAALALDKGLIPSVDTLASEYIPAWVTDDRASITVQHLLEMTSGLAQADFSPSPFSPGQRLFFGNNLDGPVEKMPLAFAPGTQFDFNHVNSQALHAVITGATGMRYADFVRDYLWRPLGGGFAQVRLDHPGGTARTFCCIQLRPMDWVRLGVMLANGGRADDQQVLSKEWTERLMTGAELNPNFGFHVWLGFPYEGTRLISQPSNRRAPVSAPFLADDVMYMEGRGGQRLYVVPSVDLVIYRAGRIDFAWDDARIINTLLSGIQTADEIAVIQ